MTAVSLLTLAIILLAAYAVSQVTVGEAVIIAAILVVVLFKIKEESTNA